MEKQESKETDYCMLGKKNGCPHIDYCAGVGSFSLEVLKVYPRRGMYDSSSLSKKGAQIITSDVERKLGKSKTWNQMGVEGITFACTEIRREGRNSLTLVGGTI